MKFLIPVLLAVLLVNCKRPFPKATKVEKPVAKPASAPKVAPPNYIKLIDVYVPLKFDTLQVFSSSNLDSIGYKYRGVQLDSTNAKVLGSNWQNIENYYANFKFDIDEYKVGLITRVPSMYESSSITLFIYDKNKKTLIEKLELAENWGDAGAVFEKRSWLFRDSKGRLKCLLHQSYYYDPKVNDEDASTAVDENNDYLINLQHSVTDTVDRNAKVLFNKMKRLR
ncbi:hypothetical protein [Mucilaginibacter terrae]|uniref:Lipoprotein n=1 Tax=Mucilaginibacter terrae TaxID=1955052 RepID=A0ABU3GVI9_9SPHI|nr:hypothetical protein [Mucilaginibacter terrae]MDT3402967.1 hypothetical protein [Mucilaginibacter terrae]